ncbi:MAG: PH domain-containing protein, partial [Planctomycetota bacterium]
FGNAVTERYLRRLRCVLTDRSLYVRSGIFVRVEKTVPLDKITDLGVVQGPIMRYLNIESLNVETAGQAMTSAIAMLGIVDNQAFRDAVLKRRDDFVGEQRHVSPDSGSGATAAHSDGVLVEIRDTLVRIEEQLKSSKSS